MVRHHGDRLLQPLPARPGKMISGRAGGPIICCAAGRGAKVIKMIMFAYPPFEHLGYRDLGRMECRLGEQAGRRQGR
jgi:hypothetical protein